MDTDHKDYTPPQELHISQEAHTPLGDVEQGQFSEPHAEGVPAYSEATAHEYPDDKPAARTSSRLPAPPPSHGGSSRGFSHGSDDPGDPGHYTRDPHKLIAYLIPFPKPVLKHVAAHDVPDRFLIYTPPPPPLTKPPEGEKEAKLHKVQRKWQEEVREAKLSDAKLASWQGIKSRATKGISWAINRTTSSSLDFLNRLGEEEKEAKKEEKEMSKRRRSEAEGAGDETVDGTAVDGQAHSETGDVSGHTPGLNELVLVYPASSHNTPEDMRTEFVNSMLRTKSKAQKDAVIATSLIPVAFAVDVLVTLIWPFGGLAEIDGVWAYASFRGAKTARSTTQRLQASEGTDHAAGGSKKEKHLKLTFTPSARVQTLARYLAARCHERDARMFPPAGGVPTETEVLEAVGWAPSQIGEAKKNWEEEQWEMAEVKEDFKQVMHKGAKEWDKWCKAFEKNPAKAVKK